MWLLLLLAVPCLAVLPADPPPKECFAEAKYITCQDVIGRPVACHCTGIEPACYIKMILSKGSDGQFYINGSQPGPTIIVRYRGIVVIDVYNNMAEDTSIHFHGMRQKNVPWIDGVGNITQYPIPAKGRFRYIFRAYPQGTHWYHSHMRYQRDKGLFGALIVHEGETPFHSFLESFEDQPERKTMAILDNMINPQTSFMGRTSVLPRYCLPDGSDIPVQFDHIQFQMNGQRLPRSTSFVGLNSQIEFYVVGGKNYRFRIIAATEENIFVISIDQHKMYVMATDGYLVKPFETDYLVVHVSERYDFILKAKKNVAPGTKFPIRIQSLAVLCNDNSKLAGESYAFLVYANGFEQMRPALPERLTVQNGRCNDKSNPCKVLNCPFEKMPNDYSNPGTYMTCFNVLALQLLIPTPHNEYPSSVVDRKDEFFFNFHQTADGLINGVKFDFPEEPILISTDIKNECKYPVECNEIGQRYCRHTVYLENYGSSTRFVLSSLRLPVPITHPIHMHGHSYFIAKFGYPEYDESGRITAPNKDLKLPSCGHPEWSDGTPEGIFVNSTTVRKDAVVVPAGGYVVIHFLQRDPGWWFMHCHIDYHLNHGMAIAIGENPIDASTPPDPLYHVTDEFCFTLQTFLVKENINEQLARPKPGNLENYNENVARPNPINAVHPSPAESEVISVEESTVVEKETKKQKFKWEHIFVH